MQEIDRSVRPLNLPHLTTAHRHPISDPADLVAPHDDLPAPGMLAPDNYPDLIAQRPNTSPQ